MVEALARVGVGQFILVDHDTIEETNINRQILATTKTIGKPKVEVAKTRILEINPFAKVETKQEFFTKESKGILDNSISYVIDAIDTVSAKIELVVQANELQIPIISCMGTGNKLDPTKFEVEDIYHTSVCPLAKVMRKELKKRNIPALKVVYSKEEPIVNKNKENETAKKKTPASISFVPSVAGLILVGEVVKELLRQ